jgi:hypothetical protein
MQNLFITVWLNKVLVVIGEMAHVNDNREKIQVSSLAVKSWSVEGG